MMDEPFAVERRQLAWYIDQLMRAEAITPEPTPAPIELCADIHRELTAAWNLLGQALYKFDNRVDRGDVVRHRTKIKELIDTLESRHIPRETNRLHRRGRDRR